MSATTNLAFVLAASIVPVGVIPLGVWVHDRLAEFADAMTWALLLMALAERADDYRGADVD